MAGECVQKGMWRIGRAPDCLSSYAFQVRALLKFTPIYKQVLLVMHLKTGTQSHAKPPLHILNGLCTLVISLSHTLN